MISNVANTNIQLLPYFKPRFRGQLTRSFHELEFRALNRELYEHFLTYGLIPAKLDLLYESACRGGIWHKYWRSLELVPPSYPAKPDGYIHIIFLETSDPRFFTRFRV